MKNLCHIKGRKLDTMELLMDMKSLQIIQYLGARNFEKVYKSKWWGLLCRTKKLNIVFIKEISILAILSYFNIIKYFFIINPKNNQNNQTLKEYDTNRELYLEIELMQTSLDHMFKKKLISFIFIIDTI